MYLYNLSRDRRVVAVTRTIAGNTNVWLLDTERRVPRRLTFDVNDNDVILSPDGTRVVHQANGTADGSVVYERRADGTGGETLLLEESVTEWHHPQDWSADGRYIMHAVTTTTGTDLRALPSPANGHRSTSRGHPFAEPNSRFSPDSRWVAYQSTETGQNEIYVQPFPGPGARITRINKWHQAPGTRHQARGTRHEAPVTRHQSRGTSHGFLVTAA
jgi:Tol biopolymer transport system component